MSIPQNIPAPPPRVAVANPDGTPSQVWWRFFNHQYVVGLNTMTGAGTVTAGNLVAFKDATGSFTADSGVSPSSLLKSASNLADLASQAQARTNLGLATVAHSGAYSDLLNPPTGTANSWSMLQTFASVNFTGTTGASNKIGTMTNAPKTGNPDYWMPVEFNGVVCYIPAWT